MSWLKRLFGLVPPPQSREDNRYRIQVRCDRCGEELATRVNLFNDLSPDYESGEDNLTYYCRKVLVGSAGCFQRIEVALVFDKDRKLISQNVSGGKALDD
jgi:hypothetical protein